ncbi:MAG: lipid-A-disaccharide synthase [Rhizobiaceae bacterium]|nr:lipid-A-disaccharide synthase [Rhizobiaceae bacterium]
MAAVRPLKIYMVLGESSGDTLGANILAEYGNQNIEYTLAGLAGPKMQEMGAKSLFDISQLAVMGLSEVIVKLPGFIKLVRRVVDDIISFNPDVLLLIDSPEFNYAVAKRVKKCDEHIPIVKYICPSVWAWRQGRAKKMRHYIDHVLAILPFEPDLMKELGGPTTTYVGHPLAGEMHKFGNRDRKIPNQPAKLLILPGSRKGEVVRLLPIIHDSLQVMRQRGNEFSTVLPAVDHLVDFIREETSHWPADLEIVTGNDAKLAAFENADAAIACSGTVMLELGIHAIPTISIYKLDKLGFVVRYLVKAWTACLPNLIVDKVIIPERFDEYANPQIIARMLEELLVAGPMRDAQLQGFKQLRKIMQKDTNSVELVASKILEIANYRT